MKNILKRIICFTAVLVIAFCLVACGGEKQQPQYYLLDSMTLEGVEYGKDILDKNGYENSYIEFTDKNSGYIVLAGASQYFEWVDETKITSGNQILFCEKGEQEAVLTGFTGDMKFIKAEKPDWIETHKQQLADSLPGVYVLTYATIDGVNMDSNRLYRNGYTNYYITIDEEMNGIVELNGVEIKCTVAKNNFFNENNSALPFIHTVDKITVEVDGDKMLFEKGEKTNIAIPVGYYECVKLFTGDNEYDRQQMSADILYFEVGEDRNAIFNSDNKVDTFQIRGHFAISDVTGRYYMIAYRNDKVHLRIDEQTQFVFERAEKPDTDINLVPGVYTLTGIIDGGEIFEIYDLADSGFEGSTVTITESKEITLFFAGDTISVEKSDGKYYIEGKDSGLTYLDGKLYMRISDIDAIFVPRE